MRVPFSVRLISSVVIIEIIMLSLLIWNSIRLISESHTQLLESTAKEQSVLLSAAITPGLISRDYAMVEDVLGLLGAKHDLDYAKIFDDSGRMIASIGSSGNEPDIQQAPGSRVEIVSNNSIDIVLPINVEGQYMGTLQVAYNTSVLESIVREIKWQNTTIALVTLLLLVIATVFTSIILTAKLRQLKRGVSEIQHGNLGHQIHLARNDEFGDLAAAFNQMAAHLSSTQNNLEKQHYVLEQQTSRLNALMHGVEAVIWESSLAGNGLGFVSNEAEDLLGYSLSRWHEEDFLLNHVHEEDHHTLSEALKKLRSENCQVSVDVRLLRQDHSNVWTRIIAGSEDAPEHDDRVLRGLMIDITEEKNREQQIVYLAEHDALTGLINRRQFQERLAHHIAYARRYNYVSSLLYIDIDQFKYVNDTFGHQAGDAYLVYITERLQRIIRDTDIFGRLGGDEFGVILPYARQQEASRVAENMLSLLAEDNWRYEGEQIHISASIGITIFPVGDKNPSQLLAEADTAMYSAKSAGRGRYHVYNEDELGMAHMQSKVRIESLIRDAIRNDRFELHFQPIVNFSTGETSHFEALLRIRKEDGELVFPGDFVDTAERFGLIGEIDQWVMAKAVSIVSDERSKGSAIHDIAVNLSGRHLDDIVFQQWLKDLLATDREVASHLIIEVTETAAVRSLITAREFIECMRELGCRFALDDFGVGFASFHYIKNLPVDYIKIDGSFVKSLHVNESDSVFVKATVDIAKSLGIATVAEYVENEHIVEILREVGADYGQGYYLGRPKEQFADGSLQ